MSQGSCERHMHLPSCVLLLALVGAVGIPGDKKIGEATHTESLLSELYLSALNSIANNIHKNLAISHLSLQHHWISEKKWEVVLPIVASWNNIFQEKICWKNKQKPSHPYRICCKHKEVLHSCKVESSADLLKDGIWPLPFSSSSLHLLSITFYRHGNRTKTFNTVSSLNFFGGNVGRRPLGILNNVIVPKNYAGTSWPKLVPTSSFVS